MREVAVIWGLAMMGVGALMFLGATTQSDFIVYRLIAARSRRAWGDSVHTFLQVSGALVVLAGHFVTIFS